MALRSLDEIREGVKDAPRNVALYFLRTDTYEGFPDDPVNGADSYAFREGRISGPYFSEAEATSFSDRTKAEFKEKGGPFDKFVPRIIRKDIPETMLNEMNPTTIVRTTLDISVDTSLYQFPHLLGDKVKAEDSLRNLYEKIAISLGNLSSKDFTENRFVRSSSGDVFLHLSQLEKSSRKYSPLAFIFDSLKRDSVFDVEQFLDFPLTDYNHNNGFDAHLSTEEFATLFPGSFSEASFLPQSILNSQDSIPFGSTLTGKRS